MDNYLIDTHCHLHDAEWFTPEQAEDFLQEAAANNVRQVIVIGTDPDDAAKAQEFAKNHPDVYWTYGIHPENAGELVKCQKLNISFFEGVRSSLASMQCAKPVKTALSDTSLKKSGTVTSGGELVAIGEIGLDYHYEGYDRAAQIKLFEQMLQLAQDLGLPVSLHIREREAFADAWAVLENFPKITGVVHSFTGSKQELKRALAHDFYIGANGLATYSTLPLPPLEKMLLETDAPFLTPEPFRGTINKPGYVRNIASYLAEKMGVAEVNIAEQTTKNARQLFQLREPSLCPGGSTGV